MPQLGSDACGRSSDEPPAEDRGDAAPRHRWHSDGIREQARHAERLDLDGILVGDHLKPAGPDPENVVVPATAAGITEASTSVSA